MRRLYSGQASSGIYGNKASHGGLKHMKVETKAVRQYENADDEERCVVKVFSSIPRPIWAGFHILQTLPRPAPIPQRFGIQTIHIWNDSTTKEQGCKKKKE